MKDETKFGIVVCLLCVAMVLILILAFTADAHAEWKVVSFDTSEQLAAISDSITDVCDTTWVDGMRLYNPFPRDTSWIQGAVGHGLVTITCRELVSITVMCYPWKDERKAKIFYREVKP